MSAKEYTAKSVEEALEKALNEMMLTREDIHYEIVQQPSKGFLGFGQKDAVVRVGKKDAVEEKIAAVEVKEEKAEVKEEKVVTLEKAAVKEDLTGKTVAELRELAKAKEIKGYSTMKKAELLEALK